jgi:hypothetical protein
MTPAEAPLRARRDPVDENKPNPLPASVYVNFMRVGYQQSEFFLAFGQVGQDRAAAHLLSSLVTTPAHAKAMLQALSEAVSKYEGRFGPIPMPAPAAQRDGESQQPGAPTREQAKRTQPTRKAG